MMRIEEIKKVFLKIMIGSLIAAASVAVVAILVGSFNEALSKSLGVIASVAIHSLVVFSFVSNRDDLRQPTNFFTSVVFFLVAASFFTSIFGILELIGEDIIGKAYATYGLLAFAALHGDALNQLRGFSQRINSLVFTNYGLMTLAVLLLLPIIYVGFDIADGFYGRLTAAVLVVDFTLTMIVYIMFRMFSNDNPEAVNGVINNKEKSSSFLGIIGKLLLLYICLQVVLGLAFLFL